MTNTLKYKDYIASIHYSSEDDVFYGKLEGIEDLVTFEAVDVKGLKKAFHDAVDDYQVLCEQTGKTPFKSFKGSFNVRVGSKLHSKAYEHALLQGKSLNQYVHDAIQSKVEEGESQYK